jgi:hypothetical protein
MVGAHTSAPSAFQKRNFRYGMRDTPARAGTSARSTPMKRPKNTARPPLATRYCSARDHRSSPTFCPRRPRRMDPPR